MADIVYRANLKAASFPFLSELMGRSIIVKGPDQVSPIGKSDSNTTDTSNQGIPQIYYCHNVIPTDNGYKSISYTSVVPQAGTSFIKVLRIVDSTGASANIAIDAAGNLYVMEYGTTVWVTGLAGAPVPATIAGKRMTVGIVSGVSYIYFSGVGGYTYDFTTNTFAAVVFSWDAPLTDADILGVASNRGYLVAHTVDVVVWSSLVDPTDFVADLATGAGGGYLEEARGTIVTIESVYGGFLVFTNTNTISAVASDNTRFPYNYLEVTGAGGLLDPDFVSYDSNSNSVFAYTTAGIQQINVKGAVVVFPEVTDFLSGALFEDYDENTNMLNLTQSSAVLHKRLVVIASRYLVISYGITALTHALYYDFGYKQWGRLKVSHVDCFEWGRVSVETPRKSMAFLSSNGSISVLNSDIIDPAANGVMLVGKIQYVRTRLLQLQSVEVENVNVGDTFSLLDLPAADGKNFGNALIGYLAASLGKYRKYFFHNTAMNHTIVFKGGWNATSLVLTFNVTGAR